MIPELAYLVFTYFWKNKYKCLSWKICHPGWVLFSKSLYGRKRDTFAAFDNTFMLKLVSEIFFKGIVTPIYIVMTHGLFLHCSYCEFSSSNFQHSFSGPFLLHIYFIDFFLKTHQSLKIFGNMFKNVKTLGLVKLQQAT